MTDNKRGILARGGKFTGNLLAGSVYFRLSRCYGAPTGKRAYTWDGAPLVTFFSLCWRLSEFSCFLVGRWQEKLGAWAMISIGAIICGLDAIFVAYASSLWMVYVWAFLVGMASSFIYIPALTTVQRWFPMRRGLVSGIVNLMFGVSAAIMAPIFGYMLETIGYLRMNIYLGIIGLVAGVVAAQFTEIPERVAWIQTAAPGGTAVPPLDLGQLSDGSTELAHEQFLVSLADLGIARRGRDRYGDAVRPLLECHVASTWSRRSLS